MLLLLTRLWGHIVPARRIQLGILFCVMLVASFVELFSIGMVIPFLGVLTSPEIIYDHRLAKPLIEFFDLKSQYDLLLPIFSVFVFAVVFAASIRLLLVFLQARIGLGIVNELATNAYHKTLCQPYAVHISRNSSEVISGILYKVSGGIGGLLGATLTLLSSLLMLIAILATLFIVDPVVALSSCLGFGAIYAMVIVLTKKQLARDSERISEASTAVIKVVQEGLGGVRDVLLDGNQSVYTATYKQADIKLKHAQANIQILSVGPRFVIEAIGIVVIALIAYLLSTRPGGLISVIPLMGTLALGAQRTLPLLQQSYASWTLIQGSRQSLRDALAFLDQPIHQNRLLTDYAATIQFNHEIRLDSVSFQYNLQTPSVLRALSLSVPKGAKVGFVGETGSGKSTLIDIIMGLLLPTDGYLIVDEQKINADNHQAWQKHIAHVPQTIFLSDASIAENIAIGLPRDKIDMPRVRLAAQRSRIADTIESWPMQYDTAVGERGVKLSGGQRQRIGIARALYKQADVIIFDEATSALDNETEHAVMQAIDGLGDDLTILIVAHRLTTLRNCSQIVELQNGKIKRVGSYADIVEKSTRSVV
jgi:ABC-type multidrug transport system fused ATPase/permease subunit